MPVIIEFSKCTDIYSSAKFELFRDRIIENIWEITKNMERRVLDLNAGLGGRIYAFEKAGI